MLHRISRCTGASRAWKLAMSLSRSFLRQFSRYSKNDQIYLHALNGGVYASLSSLPNDLPIGHLPSEVIHPNTFQPNLKFVNLLHSIIGSSIQHDFTFIMEAGANALQFMPIYDFREIPRYARTPNVDDVFGYVLVDDAGKIVPGSYEPNSLYRVCNGSGLVKLSDYLLERMRDETKEKA